MVGHHLHMVLSPCFCIDDQHLVKVKGGLQQVVEFQGASERYMRVSSPEVRWFQDTCGEVLVNVLKANVQSSSITALR